MPTRALRGPFSLADADPGRIVDKPGDISRATHGLSTEGADAPKLLSPGMPVHPVSATGFTAIQVLGSVEEIGLVHRNRPSLLLLLCIDRTFNGITRNLRTAEKPTAALLARGHPGRRKTKVSRPPWEKKKGKGKRKGLTPHRPIDRLRPIHGRQVCRTWRHRLEGGRFRANGRKMAATGTSLWIFPAQPATCPQRMAIRRFCPRRRDSGSRVPPTRFTASQVR